MNALTFKRVGFAIVILFSGVAAGVAQGSLSYLGGTYFQDFNSLTVDANYTPWSIGYKCVPVPLEGNPNWPTGEYDSLPGWYMANYGYRGVDFNFGNGDGSATGKVVSYGQPGSYDRALGMHPNSSCWPAVGLLLKNDTAGAFTGFTLNYRGEQWIAGNEDATYRGKMRFAYQIVASDDASGIFDAGFIDVNDFTFDPPNKSASGLPIDGNIYAANLSGTVDGIDWGSGKYLWLRWDANMVFDGIQHALAVDELSFVAVPEPSTIALLGAGALGLLAYAWRWRRAM